MHCGTRSATRYWSSPVPDEKSIQAALRYAAENCPLCLLCGGRAAWAGAWIPPDRLDHLFDQWHGEKMGFGYALCHGCHHAADVQEWVEAELVARHGVSQN